MSEFTVVVTLEKVMDLLGVTIMLIRACKRKTLKYT